MKRKQILKRALHIASAVLVADGVCTRDKPCRSPVARASDNRCMICIEKWLCRQSIKELKEEGVS